MKRIIMLAVMIMLTMAVLGIGNTTVIADGVGPVILCSPMGGEGWVVGETHTIKWSTSPEVKYVEIDIYVGPYETACIARHIDTSDTSEYNWLIPATILGFSGIPLSLLDSALNIGIVGFDGTGRCLGSGSACAFSILRYPPWDVNQDGVVNLIDLVTLAMHYGENGASPNWNPAADINDNGVVDLLDLVLLAKHYGESYK